MNNIYNEIKKARIALGLTQEQVAKELNVKRQTINKYEKGVIKFIPMDVRLQLSSILGIPAYKLVTDDEKIFLLSAAREMLERIDRSYAR